MKHIFSIAIVLFYSASAFAVSLTLDDLCKPWGEKEAYIFDSLIANLNNKIKKYEFVGPFHEGKAMVIKDGKMGFVGKSGDLVIPMNFIAPSDSMATEFSNLVFVKGLYADELNGVIDSKGNRLTPNGKVLRLYKEYDNFEIDNNSIDKANKGVIVAEIELENGGVKSYIFENGSLVYVMDNDYPIVHEQSGACLKDTTDGKVTFIGIKGAKKLGYEEVFNSGNVFIPNPEVPWVKDGKSCFIMNRHGRYGIIDEYCNVIHPFLHNFVLQHLNGLAILYHGKDVEDSNGYSRYLMSCDIYKDGKKIIKDASPYMMEPSSFQFIFFHGLTDKKMKEINGMLGVTLPLSTKESFILTQQGNKVDKYPWGENFLKYIIDANDLISWQLVDSTGKKVIDDEFYLLSMSDKYLCVSMPGEEQNEYVEYMINLNGAIKKLPASDYALSSYIEFGMVDFKTDLPHGTLCSYNYLLSDCDNKANTTYYIGGVGCLYNSDDDMYTYMCYDGCWCFSDGLFRIYDDGVWKFLWR